MSKKMKIIFATSLILNALLVGLFAGHMVQSHRFRPIAELNDIRPDLREQVAAQRAKLAGIMKAEKFNQADFDAALGRLSTAQSDFNREFLRGLNDRLQKMPAAKRAEIIDDILSRRRGRR